MNIVEALEALSTQGMGIVEALAREVLTRARLVELGHPSSTAGEWSQLADVYFGPTRQKKTQEKAREAAISGGLPIDALVVIEKHVRKLLDADEWSVRLELCGLRGSVDEIDRAAAARVRSINRSTPNAGERTRRRRALKGGKNTDAQGLRHISVSLPERDMADCLATLRVTARRMRSKDRTLSYEQAMADAFVTHVQGGVTKREQRPVTPLVVIGINDWAKLLKHEGDECVFALTDGTTMTGAELVTAAMSEHHLAGLWHPVDGPINLYRSERVANDKQRALLAADSILCETPGCTTAADECQAHHLTSWKHGGETNLNNLAAVCRVHNARNDDDPQAPPIHGRLERNPSGEIEFHPPDGTAVKHNRHPIREYSARAIVRRAAGGDKYDDSP